MAELLFKLGGIQPTDGVTIDIDKNSNKSKTRYFTRLGVCTAADHGVPKNISGQRATY